MFQLEKWFVELLLPILKKKLGKKLIIVDNLASHISPRQSVFTSTVPYLPTYCKYFIKKINSEPKKHFHTKL